MAHVPTHALSIGDSNKSFKMYDATETITWLTKLKKIAEQNDEFVIINLLTERKAFSRTGK